jgi:hypothetical protein
MMLLGEPQISRKNPTISSWSISQHIHHSLLVAAGIFEILGEMIEEGDKPAKPTPKGTSLLAYPVLVFGYIPRGKGRSPAQFLAPEGVKADEIVQLNAAVVGMLEDLEVNGDRLTTVPGKRAHPVLGALSASEWLRFLVIHNGHHMKIIRQLEPQGR